MYEVCGLREIGKVYHFHGMGLIRFGLFDLSNPLKTARKNRKEGGGDVIILYYFHYMLRFRPIFTVFSLFFADFLRFPSQRPPSFPKKLPLLRGFHAANRARRAARNRKKTRRTDAGSFPLKHYTFYIYICEARLRERGPDSKGQRPSGQRPSGQCTAAAGRKG